MARFHFPAPLPSLAGVALAGAVSLAGSDAAWSASLNGPTSSGPTGADGAATAVAFGRLPLLFVANEGQADPWAAYYGQGDRTTVLFGSGGLSIRQWSPPRAAACADRLETGLCLAEWQAQSVPSPLDPIEVGRRAGDPATGTVDALGLVFENARTGARPVAREPAPAKYSYFRGPRDEWHTGLPTYSRLEYQEVWPGIDVAFDADAQTIKHTFTVAAGADPAAIRLTWTGVRSVRIGADGELIAYGPGGTVVDEAPMAYQVFGGRVVPVPVRFNLEAGTGGTAAGSSGTATGTAAASGGLDRQWTYGFELGAYDNNRPLMIDPATLVWAGFLGGGTADRGLGMALGPDGSVFATGELGPAAFVAKVGGDGRSLLWMAQIDGAAADAAFDMDVDPQGAAYVSGPTSSTEATFPVTGGPDLTFNGGFVDGWIAKVAPTGDDLVYAGYLGGTASDFSEGLVVDAAGHAFVSGIAESTEATFPVTVGPDLTHNGGFDAYVMKLRVDPSAPEPVDNYEWAGFVGGAGTDILATEVSFSAGHIDIDREGNLYMSGQTSSTEATFPDGDGFGALAGPDKSYNGGEYDAYIVKVRASGEGLAYAGYIGGADYDEGKGMAIDADGAAYLTGYTTSTEDTFPVRVGPDLSYNGGLDGFVTKVLPDGSGLEFCGYFGGDNEEQGQTVKIGPDGALYVAGRSASYSVTFPSVRGPYLEYAGPDTETGLAGDAVVGRLAADVSSPDPRDNWDFLGYVGGAEPDSAFWMDVDARGNVYVIGDTYSGPDTFPGGTGMAGVPSWDPTYGGAVDGFLVRIDWRPPARQALLPWIGKGARPGDGMPARKVTREPSPTVGPSRSPQPTATASPTRKPTPVVVVPPMEEIVFFDDFSDPNSGWTQADDPGRALSYAEGRYQVTLNASNRYFGAFAPGDWRVGDGAFDVTGRLGQDNDTVYGLMFGPGQAPFVFGVNSAGIYQLLQMVGAGFTTIFGPVTTEYHRGGTQPNVLRVEKTGSRAAMFVNGQLLGAVENVGLREPARAGVFVGTFRDAPADVFFDDMLVTRFSAERPTPTAGPTATRAPTAVATATPTQPAPGTVIFEDNFSNPASGWETRDRTEDSLRYDAGEYEIALHLASRAAVSMAPGGHCDACSAEVEITFRTEAFGLGGLLLEEESRAAVVLIEMSNDGRFGVQRYDGSNWSTLLNPAVSAAIRRGANETNLLQVSRRQGTIVISANGTQLSALQVATLGGAGNHGLFALSDTSPTTVRFDDFVVRATGAQQASAPQAALSWPSVWTGVSARGAGLAGRSWPVFWDGW